MRPFLIFPDSELLFSQLPLAGLGSVPQTNLASPMGLPSTLPKSQRGIMGNRAFLLLLAPCPSPNGEDCGACDEEGRSAELF